MIKILNGIHETVAYDSLSGLKLYHNHETENYPVHWHTAVEIILPMRGEYTVIIDGAPHTFYEGDIWITPPRYASRANCTSRRREVDSAV